MKKIHNETTGRNDAKSLGSETSPEENGVRPAQDRCDDNFFRQVNIEFLVHELKAPVSIIESGALMLLERQAAGNPLTPFQQRTLERMLRNANKTRNMLAELLEVGRAQTACFQCSAFSPMAVLRQTLVAVVEAGDPALFDHVKDPSDLKERISILTSHGIRLDASPEVEGMTMDQDQVKFSQIAGNLMQNGFQHRRRHLLIHAARSQETFILAVRDDGPGIAPAHHEAIFQRYKQILPHEGIARSGHGLGLAVARILARSMGGDILVDSELGQGALFRLNLPDRFTHGTP